MIVNLDRQGRHWKNNRLKTAGFSLKRNWFKSVLGLNSPLEHPVATLQR